MKLNTQSGGGTKVEGSATGILNVEKNFLRKRIIVLSVLARSNRDCYKVSSQFKFQLEFPNCFGISKEIFIASS